MDEIKQSGDTISIPLEKPTMKGHIDTEGVLYATVENIIAEEYDEESDRYTFTIESYSGDMISINLKEKHIQKMILYMRKEQADTRYFKHIMRD